MLLVSLAYSGGELAERRFTCDIKQALVTFL